MDYISRLLNSVGEKIKGVKMEGNINLTHLLFADDILLFVEDDEHSIQNLKNIINLFQLASGLSINLNKSTISPINVDAARTEQIASQWGISTKFLPINYLGVPLGVASVKKALQQPDQSLLDLQSQNTFKNLWKTSIPKKCIFFIWTLLYDSVNTAEQLMKRLPNLCSRPSCWKQKTKKNVILYNTYASALWNIWLERNARIFNGKEKTVAEIWEDIKALAGLWTSRSSLFSNYQASSIALNLNAFS
ncbi:uncharacterized protein LOC127148989 [Cucumis melo]|uniref:Uncharacterized protein LOC127148989 n=1 Tax=Cucumis melo TaxID=3656 RepID=A0ABM3KNL4_CUCME|nr:uncharacterized protein LOC127148989 [Cucumis melo]